MNKDGVMTSHVLVSEGNMALVLLTSHVLVSEGVSLCLKFQRHMGIYKYDGNILNIVVHLGLVNLAARNSDERMRKMTSEY